MIKVLFIHGLASSGAYKTANTLRTLLRPCEVTAPDVPIKPEEALAMLREMGATLQPDLIVGLSLGGFWAQKLRGYRKILINPDLHPSHLLRSKMGEMEYLSPRRDGAKSFCITEEICAGYETLEETEFDGLDAAEIDLTDGLFATDDELVHGGPEFEIHYPGRAHAYPGRHLPTFPEIKRYLLPLVRRQEDQIL
ncbi:MAG: hypothetical protein IJ654_07695 [Bacteroidales bacterium]|nr:hypothetical protein [Bacteroidales bacterium]